MLGLVVTAICPQGLANRPVVLHPDAKIELAIRTTGGLTTLVVDGQGFAAMRQGDSVFVERHPLAYPLLGWSKLDPYRRLRERLGWSGTVAPLGQEANSEARGISAASNVSDDDLGL
jgi:NAD+ kinase